MHYAWEAILHNIAHIISDAVGDSVSADELIAPPDPRLGDLAYGCFKLAKLQSKNPAIIAKELAEKLQADDLSIESATAAGPYVNIILKTGELVSRIVKDVEAKGMEYGEHFVAAPHKIVFEYANPNTHKEIHIGHLRNFIIGSSLCHILMKSGHQMTPVSYVNDMGTNVSKCLWKLVTSHGFNVDTFSAKDLETLLLLVPTEQRSGKYLGVLYTEAVRDLGEREELQVAISKIHLKIEAHDAVWTALFQETRQWCLGELRQIFSDLGVTVERQYLESSFVDRSQAIVRELEEKKIAKMSDGALIVDFEEEKLGVVVLRRSDGALLYIAKDLALAEQKIRDYPDAAYSYIVTDKRQELNFKQLFALLKRLGHQQTCVHIGYELVTLKEGAMSSRKGNIVTWQQFRDDVLAFAMEQTTLRHPEWTDGKVTHVAWCLMMGGIKFGILRQDPDKVLIFDKEQALSFDGATGPYVQYATIRLGSILRKAGWTEDVGTSQGDVMQLTEPVEKQLALCMAKLPAVIARAGRELRPSLVAQWCLDMAGCTNDFYRDVKVLDAVQDVKDARLRLVAAARTVLSIGLSQLGIPLSEEM